MDTPNVLPEKYQDFVQRTVQHICEMLRTEGQVRPVCFVANDQGEMDIVMMDMSSVQAKDFSSMVVRQRCLENNASMVLMISESWRLPPELSTPEKYKEIKEKYGDIESSPYRVEVMMFMLETHDGHWMAAPNMSGKDRTFDDPDWFKSGGSDGRFVNFLPKHKPFKHHAEADALFKKYGW